MERVYGVERIQRGLVQVVSERIEVGFLLVGIVHLTYLQFPVVFTEKRDGNGCRAPPHRLLLFVLLFDGVSVVDVFGQLQHRIRNDRRQTRRTANGQR